MPQLDVTVKAARVIWTSPDGQRTINEVLLEVPGQGEVSAKTYSKDIATQGWTGTVETYEKSGRNGSETFVKQPQKEFTPGAPQGGGGGYKGGGKPQGDQFTMYLSYAKDIAVAMMQGEGFDQAKFVQILADVATGGEFLFDAHTNKDHVAIQDADGISKEDLNALFPDDEAPADGEEDPWKKANPIKS